MLVEAPKLVEWVEKVRVVDAFVYQATSAWGRLGLFPEIQLDFAGLMLIPERAVFEC